MIHLETDFGAAATEIKADLVCAEAVELAMSSAREMAAGEVGVHLGVRAEADRLVTHLIEAKLAGYTGWYWAVTIGRAAGFAPTVAEIVLLPGSESILAAPWIPWSARLQPGDLSPGDLLPTDPEDPRLVPGYLLTDDEFVLTDAENDVVFELGLGRARVMSRDARLDTADRWLAGDGGPETAMARQAPAHCGSCGFLLQLSGSLRAAFGVCANEITETDGRVVSVEHGCGAHSDAGVQTQGQEHFLAERGEVFDDDAIDFRQNETPTAVAEAVLASDAAPGAVAEADPARDEAPGAVAEADPARDEAPGAVAEAIVAGEDTSAADAAAVPDVELPDVDVPKSGTGHEPAVLPIAASIDVLADLGVDLDG